MSQLEDAKRKYEEVPIPPELSDRVRMAVDQSEKRHRGLEKDGMAEKDGRSGKTGKKTGVITRIGKWAAAAAALLVIFTAALNTSTAFAQMAAQLPVIGTVARVLTFRSYVNEDGDLKISVEIPSVEMIAQDTNGLAAPLNQEIHDMCSRYGDEATARALEYKKAFMDTGGTQEEWEAHDIQIRVWYEIKSQTEDYLSFAVMGTESWTSAFSEARYYSIDLKAAKLVTLKDILGEDYIRLASDSIRTQITQMREGADAGSIPFWTPQEGGFTEITPGTRFYMNEAGNPVLVFDQYEIAPGAAGEPEFEIKRNK